MIETTKKDGKSEMMYPSAARPRLDHKQGEIDYSGHSMVEQGEIGYSFIVWMSDW